MLALRLWGTMWINLYNKARRNGMRKPALGFASKWGRHGARQRKWLAVCALRRQGGGFLRVVYGKQAAVCSLKRPFRGCLPCVKAVVWHSDMCLLALPDGRFCVARRLVLRSAVAFVARKRGAKRAAVSVLPFFGVAFSCSLCLQKLLPAWRSGAAMQVSPFASPRVCDSVGCAAQLSFSA